MNEPVKIQLVQGRDYETNIQRKSSHVDPSYNSCKLTSQPYIDGLKDHISIFMTAVGVVRPTSCSGLTKPVLFVGLYGEHSDYIVLCRGNRHCWQDLRLAYVYL